MKMTRCLFKAMNHEHQNHQVEPDHNYSHQQKNSWEYLGHIPDRDQDQKQPLDHVLDHHPKSVQDLGQDLVQGHWNVRNQDLDQGHMLVQDQDHDQALGLMQDPDHGQDLDPKLLTGQDLDQAQDRNLLLHQVQDQDQDPKVVQDQNQKINLLVDQGPGQA